MNPDNVRLSTKKQCEIFWKKHDPDVCNLNSENYGGSIEMIFCKDHNNGPGPYRPKGTYIFIDSDVRE